MTVVGRFAPTPSGDLHFGSLVAALGSWLQVRSVGGRWLVRIDDVDRPRVVPGAADRILHTLEAFGLTWDGDVAYQLPRGDRYAVALKQLQAQDLLYRCDCSRSRLAALQLPRSEEGAWIYPGLCRNRGLGDGAVAVRLRVTDLPTVTVADRLQGSYHQDLATDVGDFVLRRADGVYAYHLATVLDDADQGVTHVVRGADLLPSTPRQVALQRLLNLPTPVYAHLPVVTVAGQKLSKQTLAQPLQPSLAPQQIRAALAFLDLHPPAELTSLPDLLAWAIAHFDLDQLPRTRSRPCSDTAVSVVSQPSSQL